MSFVTVAFLLWVFVQHLVAGKLSVFEWFKGYQLLQNVSLAIFILANFNGINFPHSSITPVAQKNALLEKITQLPAMGHQFTGEWAFLHFSVPSHLRCHQTVTQTLVLHSPRHQVMHGYEKYSFTTLLTLYTRIPNFLPVNFVSVDANQTRLLKLLLQRQPI